MTLRHHHHPQLVTNAPDAIAEHPLRLLHPRTGTPLLFATEHHASRILELEPEESDRTIAEIFGHLYGPEKVYVHRWQLNDLVIWDNLAIQHAREEEAAYEDGPRVMQRIALNEISLVALMEGMEQRAM
jgi:taurine dioxygenase